MRRTRISYGSLGFLFLVFLSSLWLADRFGWGWYALSILTAVHCIKHAAYARPNNQFPPRGPITWIGFFLHKVLYPVALPFATGELFLRGKLLAHFASKHPASFIAAASSDLQADIRSRRVNLGLQQGGTEDDRSAEIELIKT